jgi:hypothetical protein
MNFFVKVNLFAEHRVLGVNEKLIVIKVSMISIFGNIFRGYFFMED